MSDGMMGDRVSRSLSMWVFAAVIATMPCAASASEQVGQVVRTSVQVSGQSGALAKGDAIHRNERIRSNASGTGAFIFEDGTKLAVGPNSSIVIDEFVYRGGAKIDKLVIGASRGTLRWISGKSDQLRLPDHDTFRRIGRARHSLRRLCRAGRSDRRDPAQRSSGVLQRAGL